MLLLIIFIGAIYLLFRFVLLKINTPLYQTRATDTIREIKILGDRHGLDFEQVYLNPENELAATIKGLTVKFNPVGDLSRQILSLQKIIKSSTIIKNKRIIDFRFDKIIIK